MIVSKKKSLIDTVRITRNHGITHTLKERYTKGYPWDYDVKIAGYNYRLDEIRASLGISQLKQIKHLNNKRKKAYKYYNKHFANIKGISIPDNDNLSDHACHLYILKINKKLFQFPEMMYSKNYWY